MDLIEIIIFLGMLALAYAIGQIIEGMHYESILKRESALLNFPVSNIKQIPPSANIDQSFLVSGHVVISGDYFKQILTTLISLVGGRLIGYESIMDRGRREAILRMKESAIKQGGEGIYNMCFLTTRLDKPDASGGAGMFWVVAYGTAVTYQKQ